MCVSRIQVQAARRPKSGHGTRGRSARGCTRQQNGCNSNSSRVPRFWYNYSIFIYAAGECTEARVSHNLLKYDRGKNALAVCVRVCVCARHMNKWRKFRSVCGRQRSTGAQHILHTHISALARRNRKYSCGGGGRRKRNWRLHAHRKHCSLY